MPPLITVDDLKVWYPLRAGLVASLLGREQRYVRAVDGVSFELQRGEIFGLAGESGCGKTTTGKALLRLVRPSAGSIQYAGTNILSLPNSALKAYRRRLQMIFQDPYGSLNPRQTVREIVGEPLKVHGLARDRDELRERVSGALADAGLTPVDRFLNRYPHELSGGQQQRVAIAAVLVLEPDFIVADEPVSMLDVSVRSEILRLMLNLRDTAHLTYLFITHDLSLAWTISDRIGIMYLGRLVEIGPADDVVHRPLHPYTEALISVVPSPDPAARDRQRTILEGDPPNPVEIPSGCRFHPRCPIAESRCRVEVPAFREIRPGHYAACHFAEP
jgi:oligopeptide/dipeptide ABC transporter ATP-binding protein